VIEARSASEVMYGQASLALRASREPQVLLVESENGAILAEKENW